ncbi:hypothetical protein VCRA219O19_80060 [Vibrio crassostreae]|nr:hypothetical protein VCRA219O19_80060 [Vibrio crassostreae]
MLIDVVSITTLSSVNSSFLFFESVQTGSKPPFTTIYFVSILVILYLSTLPPLGFAPKGSKLQFVRIIWGLNLALTLTK